MSLEGERGIANILENFNSSQFQQQLENINGKVEQLNMSMEQIESTLLQQANNETQ